MPGVLARNPALTNPRLLDCFTVTSRPEIVDDKGYSTVPNPEHIYQCYGVVCTASPNDIERLPEGDYAGKTISVVTQFRLRTASDGFKADLVTWAGSVFMVGAVDDYTRYGPGWVQAVCPSAVNLDPAPGESC